MKKAIAIIISLCFLVQLTARFAVIGYYKLNKNYIARNLCENKDKPKSTCCGKCYLRKQLKKVDDNESPVKKAPVKTEKNEILVAVVTPPRHFSIQPLIVADATSIQNPVFQSMYASAVPFSVFHPPSPNC